MASCLVLETTNREPVAIVVVVGVQERIVVDVVQGHAVREVAIALRGTPEERVVALVFVMAVAVPEAGRQRRKRVGVRAVTAIVPTGQGLELFTCC